HSSTNQHKPSSNKSGSKQINNTESHTHPILLPVPRCLASIVGQSEELLNKKQADKINDHSASMNKNDEPDSSIEQTKPKQKWSRIQIDNSNDTCNHELLLTMSDHSSYRDKETNSFDEWLERVKAFNAKSVIMTRTSQGIQESGLALELKKIKIAPYDRIKVIESLACWTDRLESFYLDPLITIFYSLVASNIFFCPPHTMINDELEFMRILLSILTSKYKMRDDIITFRCISSTLRALSKLAEKSVFFAENINNIVPILLRLIFEIEEKKIIHQHVSNALVALVKLATNKINRTDIKDENVINAINRLLYHATRLVGTFNELSLSSVMGVITRLMLLEIEDMQSIMNFFNASLHFIVPIIKKSATPTGLSNTLSVILLSLQKNDDNMKIPDNIDITKDIIEPLVLCVNKDIEIKPGFNGYNLSTLLRDISSFKDMDLLEMKNIFEPVVILITLLPRVTKERDTSAADIGVMMLNAGRVMIPDMMSINAVADSLPSMLAIVHDRLEIFSLKEISQVLVYLKDMTRKGMSWNIKYDDLIYDMMVNVYKKRANLTIVDSCFVTGSLSELLSFGLIGERSKKLIEFLKNTLLPYIVKKKEYIDKNQIIHIIWRLAVLGECIEVPQSLLLHFINTDIIDSLSQASPSVNVSNMKVSKILWSLTYFYIQPTVSKHLKRALKKSMHILFEKLESILKKRNEYSKKWLNIYTRTFILAACWLNIYVDIDVLTSYYDKPKTQSSGRQRELLKKMKRFFSDEIIESEKGAKGFSDLDILIQKYMFGIEVEGPSHYSNYPKKLRVGSTIMKLSTYHKLGYTVIEVPVLDIANDKKIEELYKKIKQHMIKWNQPIGFNMYNMFNILSDEPTD
ncbi:MAG: hypothetical protein KAG53_03775, partial [Endozoicomonadaceae bacterium]|nr:hypothetical protein [Endozoicomonadaceae bacterium]